MTNRLTLSKETVRALRVSTNIRTGDGDPDRPSGGGGSLCGSWNQSDLCPPPPDPPTPHVSDRAPRESVGRYLC